MRFSEEKEKEDEMVETRLWEPERGVTEEMGEKEEEEAMGIRVGGGK